MPADDGSLKVSKETRWLFTLAGSTLLLFGGFLGSAFQLGAKYPTKEEVAQQLTQQIDQIRREMSMANETAKANAETMRAEMRGGFETLRAQLDALRAEQRVAGGQ